MIDEAMTKTGLKDWLFLHVFEEKWAERRLFTLPALSGGTAKDIFEVVQAVTEWVQHVLVFS